MCKYVRLIKAANLKLEATTLLEVISFLKIDRGILHYKYKISMIICLWVIIVIIDDNMWHDQGGLSHIFFLFIAWTILEKKRWRTGFLPILNEKQQNKTKPKKKKKLRDNFFPSTGHKIKRNYRFFFLFMSDAHHGINSSTQKYQSTQSSVVLTSCRQDSGSPPFWSRPSSLKISYYEMSCSQKIENCRYYIISNARTLTIV